MPSPTQAAGLHEVVIVDRSNPLDGEAVQQGRSSAQNRLGILLSAYAGGDPQNDIEAYARG